MGTANRQGRDTPGAEPRVTVLIPCYNLGAYLDDAVESVLAQTYQDFEILIIDDGSTDAETVRLLDGYVRPKTTVYRTPNRKLAAARNFLIERARGEYLCALDADDKLHPEYLKKTIAALEENPSLGFVSTRLKMFGADTRVWPDDTRCDLVTLLCDDPVHSAALVRGSPEPETLPAQNAPFAALWTTLSGVRSPASLAIRLNPGGSARLPANPTPLFVPVC